MKSILLFLLALAAGTSSLVADIEKNTNLEIKILGVPPEETARINSIYRVDNAGNIRMWEIGTIRAVGLDATALAKKIESAYKTAQIYTTPSIQIQTSEIDDIVQNVVTVMGSVNKPGAIQHIQGMTLASALATAGGPSTFGTTRRVTVFREGKKYLLSPLTNENHKLEKIYPEDLIEVDQVKAFENGGE